MKKISTLVGIATLLTVVTACSSIQGVVRDKPTGSPISSATVTVGSNSTTTDAMGAYHLPTPEPEEAMVVNAPGYNVYTKTVGEDKIHDIDLVPR